MVNAVELNPYPPPKFIRGFPFHPPKSDTLIKMPSFAFKQSLGIQLRKDYLWSLCIALGISEDLKMISI